MPWERRRRASQPPSRKVSAYFAALTRASAASLRYLGEMRGRGGKRFATRP